MSATKLASVLEDYLELPNGQVIELDSPEFKYWLEAPEIRSFRFQHGFAGEQSFTARKESTKKGDADYWYGYRKVKGKLHKRYIGKSEDVTRLQLEQVAIALETPAPKRDKSESYIENYVTSDMVQAQHASYIEDYVTTKELTTCQQYCEQLEAELKQMRQERKELEEQVYQLKGELEDLRNQPKQQLDYEALRYRALASLKLGRQAPGYKTASKALSRFIALLNQP